MSKIRFIKLLLILICLSGLDIHGQGKVITETEFSAAAKKASEKMKTMSVRFVSKNEHYFGDELKFIESNTNEFVPPDKIRNVFEAKMFDRNKIILSESIQIGDDRYERKNGGDWSKRVLEKVISSSNNHVKVVENDSKFYLTENVRLGSQTANLYEKIYESKFVSPNQTASEAKGTVFYRREKRWISRTGLLLKVESEEESHQMRKVMSRRITTYDYDSNIKIEAPIK
jgi:hypothetical protein